MTRFSSFFSIVWVVVFVFTIQIISVTEMYYSPVFKGVGLLLCVIFSYRAFIYIRKCKLLIQFIYVLLFITPIYLAINNYLHHNDIGQKTLFYYINNITLVNIFVCGFETNIISKVRLLSYFLYGLVLINFISILVYSNGIIYNIMYENGEIWLLGHKNGIIRALLPALSLNIISSYQNEGKLKGKDIILLVISVASVVLVHSSTSILVLFFFILQICFIKKIKNINQYNLRNIYIVFLILSVLLVFYSIQTYFSDYFEEYLGKDASFSNRTLIWEIVILNLADSPIWGLALNEGEEFADSIGLFAGATHSHNFMLWLLSQGGVVYLIIYSTIILCINKLLSHIKNYECLVLTLMYSSFFVEGLTESITNSCLFFPLLALYIPLSQRNNNEY